MIETVPDDLAAPCARNVPSAPVTSLPLFAPLLAAFSGALPSIMISTPAIGAFEPEATTLPL